MKQKIKESERQYNYVLLAENAYLNDNKKRAIDFYEKALEFRGEVIDKIAILYNIAHIYDELNYLSESLEYYEKILDIDPEEEGAYYGKAMIYEKNGL